ncbi:FHA domain-containing protein, partial [Castellaniella sp.]
MHRPRPIDPAHAVELDLCFEDGRRRRERCALPLLIGRDAACGLALRAWRVGRRHARLQWRRDEVWIEDLGSLCGTTVNGERIAAYGPLLAHDEVVIGPCLMRVLPAGTAVEPQADQAAPTVAAEYALDAAAAGAGAMNAGVEDVRTMAGTRHEPRRAGPSPYRAAPGHETGGTHPGDVHPGDVHADEPGTPPIDVARSAALAAQAHRRRLHEGLIAALQ